MSLVNVDRALISVYDKSGLVEFARRLAASGVRLVSSGGTAAVLTAASIAVEEVASVTGAEEILGGRVKTLHPIIHGGILARTDDPDDMADLKSRGIERFELVVVNFYPFRETAADNSASELDIVEKIDIGGPAMARAGAKNHRHVGVVTSPNQYEEVAAAIEAGGLDDDLRRRLAAEAFFHSAAYDAAIVGWMSDDVVLPLRHVSALRYGENPHQSASVLVEDGASPWWLEAKLHQGKQMSFNNYADAEAAWRLAAALPSPSAVVVKHTNPSGAGVASTVAGAFEKAWSGDPLAAFGGVVAINGALDAETASLIADRFVEVLIVLEVDPRARELLEPKANLRVLTAALPTSSDADYRRLSGGFLRQVRDPVDIGEWQVVSRRRPSPVEMSGMRHAWVVAAHAKSNAVVLFAGDQAVGVGAGDQSRVGAAERAISKAGDRARGAVAASDAFFPFRDGVDALAAAGVTAIVEPGGSVRDPEVIEAADDHDVALLFTGRRHFRH